MAAGRNFAFKIAAVLLQIETWLLLSAYTNLSSLDPMVPSLTLYDVRFSHNTCVTDRQTNRGHIGRPTKIKRPVVRLDNTFSTLVKVVIII